MINILYVIWSLGLGGAEQVVINLVRGLDKDKFQPFICCLNDEGRFAEELKIEGIQVFTLNKARGVDFSVVPKLVDIIKENNIHVVHTHLWGANFWGRFAASAAKVPVVITEHNIDVWKSFLHFIIDRFLLKKTDCFIAVSETVRDFYLRKLGIKNDRIKVLYNGVDINNNEGRIIKVEEQENFKRELGIEKDEKVISVIGRLVPQKGHAFLFDAISRLSLGNRGQGLASGIKVLVVGDGPMLEPLKQKAAGYKLQNKIKFLGFRKDITKILSITDALVLPSSREGLPIVLLEAMAAGIIVVATRVGGTPELVEDGVSGFLVEYGDVDGLSQKLEEVLTEAKPRQSGARLSLGQVRENAKKMLREKFSLKKMVLEHEKVYFGLLK